jgi:hypothetical protein
VKPGDRTEIPTVAEVVRDGAAIADPQGTDTVVTALFEGFEDDDRPATASEDLAGELMQTVEAADPELDSPAARMAAACAVWLATNPDQEHVAGHVLQESARLVFEGDPPEPVAAWLAERELSV